MLIRFVWLVCLISMFTSTCSYAVKSSSVERFVCESKRLKTQLTVEQLRSEPAAYCGKVFEVRGRVLGYAETSHGITMMLESSTKETFGIRVDQKLEESPGTQIACLVKIGPDSQYSLSDLEIACWTYEADLRRQEESVKRSEALRAARPTSRALTKNREPVVASSGDEMVRAYANAIRGYNKKLSKADSEKLAMAVLQFSTHYKVDPRLVMAVIISESSFNTNAVSYAGAMGLGQLMPATAAGLGVSNAFDPVDNIYGSIRYIRSMIDRTSGKKWDDMTWQDLSLALAAYNAGPNAVKKHGGIPPYKQTQNYITKVTKVYKKLCGIK